MALQGRRSKPVVAAAAVLLGLTAVAFTLDGSPTPRPWYLFVATAAVFTLLAVGIAAERSRSTLLAGAYVAVLCGFFLRASPFVRVVSSGLDYGRWLSYAERFLETGSLGTGDMYAASPLYVLDVVVGNWVVGGPMYAARFYTVTVSALLPLLVGLLAHRLTGRAEAGYLSVILSASGALFFRTSALLESESLALCWFVLGVYLFVRALETPDRRYLGAFLFVAATMVMVHFFYGVVLCATVAGTLVLWYLVHRTDLVRLPRIPHGFRLNLAVAAVGVATTSWILWSVYAHTAVATLESATTVQSSASPFAFLIPSSGVTGESIGAVEGAAASGGDAGGESSLASSLLVRLYPVVILSAVAAVGALFAYRDSVRGHVALVVAAVVGAMTVVATFVGLDYDLGFRMYYFGVVFAIVFASLALAVGLRSERWRDARPVVVAAMVVFVFSYALVSPVTPIGNNIDPKLGGSSWTLTDTEHEQLRQLQLRFERGGPIESALSQTHDYFLPDVESSGSPATDADPLYIADVGCESGNASQVSDTGAYSICQPD